MTATTTGASTRSAVKAEAAGSRDDFDGFESWGSLASCASFASCAGLGSCAALASCGGLDSSDGRVVCDDSEDSGGIGRSAGCVLPRA